MSKSTLFVIAWSIARTAAATFGGSVKSYFSESLKLAYAQQTTKADRSNEEKLIGLGLKIWEKGNHRRVYFSKAQLENLFGLDVDYNSRGGVSFASIQGEKISNTTASEWLANAGYYDCNKNKFVGAFATSKRLANILENA